MIKNNLTLMANIVKSSPSSEILKMVDWIFTRFDNDVRAPKANEDVAR